MARKSIYEQVKVNCTFSITPLAKQWLIEEAERLKLRNPSEYLEKLARGEISA